MIFEQLAELLNDCLILWGHVSDLGTISEQMLSLSQRVSLRILSRFPYTSNSQRNMALPGRLGLGLI